MSHIGFIELNIKATKIISPAKKNSAMFLNKPKNNRMPQINSTNDERAIVGFNKKNGK